MNKRHTDSIIIKPRNYYNFVFKNKNYEIHLASLNFNTFSNFVKDFLTFVKIKLHNIGNQES